MTQPPPIPILLDTDIQGDVDDVGAVAALHALAARGECTILGMGVSAKHPACVPCLDALNHYFGRPDIPIGVVKGEAFFRESKYNRQIADEFPHRLNTADDAPDAALLYRQLLARQPERSVVLVSIGQLTNMRNLLRTEPDELSPLDGRDLVHRHIHTWVCMGGVFPQGREANLVHDGPAAAQAVRAWPTPIVFSGFEIGQAIHTGGRLGELPATSPVRRAYELFKGGTLPHKSYDQTAVLYAARGLDGSLNHLWNLETDGTCAVDDDGANAWIPTPHDPPHAYLKAKAPNEHVARTIEELMLYDGQ